ncbi:MAG: threonylcarbamoyl-AMP synthase [Clostridiales Family XIII bacterium]|nr:threonylcarbamoyl-AMP synthase [Clostridiales Family XIII bacterium]
MNTQIFNTCAFLSEADSAGFSRPKKKFSPKALAEESNIHKAAELLKQGGLVAFPTETVYGLGANAWDAEASSRIYATKGRPQDNPMIVHIPEAEDLWRLVEESNSSHRATAEMLAEAFWPGPLTLILKKKTIVPDVVTGGLPTVAVRMPAHPVALAFLRAAGCPVAAPSANLSGAPSPTKGEHVIRDLDGKIDAILLGDDSRIGIESTVLDLTTETPVILRPGVIGRNELSAVLSREVRLDATLLQNKEGHEERPRAPGMKYRHYAPKAEMIVIKGDSTAIHKEALRWKAQEEAKGRKVGLFFPDDGTTEDAAKIFYAQLRQMDEEGVDLILAGAVQKTDDIGFALMNRMLKSAGYRVILV